MEDAHPLFIITSTKQHPDRMKFIRKLAQTLYSANISLWIVVECSQSVDQQVKTCLERSGVPTLYMGSTCNHKSLIQRKVALDLLREKRVTGNVYIADEENLYHPDLFDVLRQVKQLGIIPVGCLGPAGIERPLIKAGKIVGWEADLKEREYPVSTAAIALHTDVLYQIGDPLWPIDAKLGGETEFLERVAIFVDHFEVPTERVLVWQGAALGDIENLPGQAASPGLTHLASYEDGNANGPIQRSEACLLYGLTLITRPRHIVEIGAGDGHSARNFLQALDPWSKLTSVDCTRKIHVAEMEAGFRNYTFLHKNQEDLSAEDFPDPIDFLFVDASHDLEKNRIMFEKIKSCLTHDCIMAVHDTGAWVEAFAQSYRRRAKGVRCPWTNGFYHQVDEVRFIQWLQVTYSDWNVIHLHSDRCLRHGITILQKSYPLL